MMMQMSIKAGKNLDKKGNDVLMKALKQINDRKAMVPKKKEELTHEDRQRVLKYLMFIFLKKKEMVQ